MRPPALSLPAEIVAEIFTKFLPSYPECPPLHGLHSPLLLGQICGLWRAIAFSTPSLWRAVEIKLSEDDSLRVADIQNILNIWLSRSGSGPLSIRLESPQPTKHITVNVDPIVDTIIGHSHRLEYFDVHMPLESLLTIEGAMPLLKQLDLSPTRLPYGRVEVAVELFTDGPQLTHVVLGELFAPAAIQLPWTQLTHIDARCLYATECMEILYSCSPLVSFKARLTCGQCEARGGKLLVLPHLRELILYATEEDSGEEVASVLVRLTLPALRIIGLPDPCHSSGYVYMTTKEEVTNLIVRSGGVLDELRIYKAAELDSEYRKAFPQVQTIILIIET